MNPKILALQMVDNRRLPEIAVEFDDLSEIQRKDEPQGDKVFSGFSKLIGIRRIGEEVLIQMEAIS